MDTISNAEQLHQRFCELAGLDPQDLRFHKHWSRYFWEFQKEGFTIEEMEMVVRFVQSQNKLASEPRFKRQIVPSKILGDLERFCEDLALARQRIARTQARTRTPAEQVTDNFRGYRAPEAPATLADTTQSVRDVLKRALEAP